MLDSRIQEELRTRFNPDGSDLRNAQLRMLEMLKYVDKICRENNIKYWLSSGTCLGAVRHGGFIPWDDDVDIEMCADDFVKLRKVIESQSDCPYKWQDMESDPSYSLPFAKLRDTKSLVNEIDGRDQKYVYNGIFIDIFVITPSNSLKMRNFTSYLYCGLIHRVGFTHSIRKFIKNHFIPVLEVFQHIHTKGVYRHISGAYFFKERYQDDFKEVSYVKFEDTTLPVPVNYHHYLTTIYSDYEKLPDLDTLEHHFVKIDFFE